MNVEEVSVACSPKRVFGLLLIMDETYLALYVGVTRQISVLASDG